MTAPIFYNPGDELQMPFRITADNGPVDLTQCVVKAIVKSSSSTIILTAENGGLVVSNSNAEGKDPHGLITLSEEQTLTLKSNVSTLHLQVIALGDVTLSTERYVFKKQGV